MSNPGLRFVIAGPHAPHEFAGKVIKFVGVSAAPDPANRFQTINGVAVFVLVDEGGIARFLGPASNLVDRSVPGDVFPIGRAGPSHLRFQQAPIVDDVLLEKEGAEERLKKAIDFELGGWAE